MARKHIPEFLQLAEWLPKQGFARCGDKGYRLPVEAETKVSEDGAVQAVISTRARDRAGDIVEPLGADMKSYQKNPVVLWSHDWTQRPPSPREMWLRRPTTLPIASHCEAVRTRNFTWWWKQQRMSRR